MLHVVQKGIAVATEDDLAGCFGNLLDCPDSAILVQIKGNVAAAAESAALVFMHCAYENALFELLRHLVRYDPKPWLMCIDKKPIAFEKVRAMDVSEIQQGLFKDWLDAVERESLPKKAERLLAALQPDSLRGVIDGFDFDIEELRAIDQLRHDATHRPNLATRIEDVSGKLRYLHCTVLMFEELARRKYPGNNGTR